MKQIEQELAALKAEFQELRNELRTQKKSEAVNKPTAGSEDKLEDWCRDYTFRKTPGFRRGNDNAVVLPCPWDEFATTYKPIREDGECLVYSNGIEEFSIPLSLVKVINTIVNEFRMPVSLANYFTKEAEKEREHQKQKEMLELQLALKQGKKNEKTPLSKKETVINYLENYAEPQTPVEIAAATKIPLEDVYIILEKLEDGGRVESSDGEYSKS